MNFLAHCLIGEKAFENSAAEPADQRTNALIAGGFLGDFIKGPVPAEMPADLALGVKLHRRVDAYSNQQPAIRRSCNRFPSELRRIAPILVDIIADHLLTREWSRFHNQPISTFTRRSYDLITDHRQWLTSDGHRFLNYAREVDLLASCNDWQVSVRAMHSITRRLGKSELDPMLGTATESILDDLHGDFLEYFPDIIEHAQTWVVSG